VQTPEISKEINESGLLVVDDVGGRVLKEGSMRLWINDPETGNKAPVRDRSKACLVLCLCVFCMQVTA
jgi:hypothetical protein